LPSLSIIRADASAIPFVMATERTAGFDQLVGRWEEAQHRAALVDGRHAYFIGRDGAEPIGFVIVRDWASPERVTLIKRIAVGRPGRGYGRRMAEGGRQRGSLGCLSRHPFFQGDSVFAIQRGAVSFFDDPAQAVTPLWRSADRALGPYIRR
jgi:ribosomal protein S18 acetylase RimI-like enzyme